jgi:predicted small secreted protein
MRAVSCVVGICLFLAGCATSGPLGKDVLVAGVAPKKSRIVIYRVSALGFAVQPDYIIDGKAVAPSQPEGFVVCHLDPGKHQISVGNFELNVNLGGGSDQAGVVMRPGQTTYLKAEPQVGLTLGVITLTEVTEGQGQSDTAALHKLDGACA